MLQIKLYQAELELVKERLAVRNITDGSVVDQILELDEQVRRLKPTAKGIQSAINAASKEIGMLMGKGERMLPEAKKQKWLQKKADQQTLASRLADAEKHCMISSCCYPIFPIHLYPREKHLEDNVVAKEGRQTQPARRCGSALGAHQKYDPWILKPALK